MKSFVTIWREHLQNGVQPLHELSQGVYDYVMQRCGDRSLSFDNLFGKGTRIVVPAMRSSAEGMIGEIVRLFEDSGWQLNFEDSTVSKEITTTIPKGPRQGEKITQTKTMRIGKALHQALKFVTKYVEAYDVATKAGTNSDAMVADIMGLTGTPIDDDEEVVAARKLIKQAEQNLEIPRKNLKQFLPAAVNSAPALEARLPKLIKFWENPDTGADHFRQNPEEAYEKDVPLVMLSRHPIDVTRMSDMSGIRSCMAEDPQYGGYFHCAIAEACAGGPIAIMVERDEFERYFGVDLDETDASEVDLPVSEEIFADNDRNISGMEAGGRVLMRKFRNKDGVEIAVPETSTYAPGRSQRVGRAGFVKGVQKWALEAQKDVIGDPTKLAYEIYDEAWQRHGSHYEDTTDGRLFADMLEPLIVADTIEDLIQAGNMPHADPGEKEQSEIESDIEGMVHDIENQADEIQDYADENLKHFGVYHEIMDHEPGWGGGSNVYYNGHTQIELSHEFGEPIEGDWDDHEDEVNKILVEAFDNNYIYIGDADPQIYNSQWTTEVPLSYDDEPTVEGFESFVKDLINNEGNWDEILEYARDKFVDEGIIEPEISKALRQFKRYDRLNVKVTPEERQIDVFTKKPIHLLKNWRAFKEFPLEDQDKIKEDFVKKFYDAASEYLMEISDHVGLTALTDVGYGGMYLLPDQLGINVDLQGINLRFQLSFKYNDKNDKQVDAIKRFLNTLNATTNYHKLEDIAFRAFHEAMPETYRPPSSEEEPQASEVDVNELFETKSKKTKVNDKILFESWRRYLGK